MEESVISSVFKRRAIWDPADPLRKHAKLLTPLWEEVALEVGLDVRTVKVKWKNLRAYFAKELMKSGSGGNDNVTSLWSHFKQMMFLKDIVVNTEGLKDSNIGSQVNSPSQNPASASSQLTESTDQTYCDSDNTPDEIPSPPANKSFSTQTDTNFPGTLLNTPADRCRANKRKLSRYGTLSDVDNIKINDELVHIENKKLALLEKEINSKEDPDLCFFKSLLPYMRALSPGHKLRVRGIIQDLVLDNYEKRNFSVGTPQFDHGYGSRAAQSSLSNSTDVKCFPMEQQSSDSNGEHL